MGQKRKRGQLAAETAAAAASSTGQPLTKSAAAKSKRKKRNVTEEIGGNTPKGFLNLINHRERVARTIQDSADADQWKKDAALAAEMEKLVPRVGEKMGDFGRRVDSALPIKYTKTKEAKTEGIEDFAEKRRKKQAARQRQQNEEHLNMLRKKHERKYETTDKDWDDYEFATHTKSGRKRQKSPDPWAVLLKPERQYKFNDSVEAPPILSNKGKFVKKLVK